MESLSTYTLTDFPPEIKEMLFSMYKRSYEEAKLDVWSKNAEEFFTKNKKNKCLVCFSNEEKDYKRAYVMNQIRTKYNKISVVAHDGTPEGKRILFELLTKLLTEPGTIIEASGAVSWIIRNKFRIPMILVKEQIMDALDITPSSESEMIEMNPDFNPEEKVTYAYTHVYKFRDKEFRNQETLFGLYPGCPYENDNCDRKCPVVAVSGAAGGKRRKNKISKKRRISKKHRKIKKKTIKKYKK
jgi:hypothetical protein